MKYYKMLYKSSQPYMWQMIDEKNNVAVVIGGRAISVHNCTDVGEDWIPATKDEVNAAAQATMSNVIKSLGL